MQWPDPNKLDIVKEALETQNVILFVNSDSFKDNAVSTVATHYIHISSIEDTWDGYIKIEFWDYGRQEPIELSPAQFRLSVFGIIKIPT